MKRSLETRLVMIAELSVRPERLAEFLDYTAENLPVCRSYPGNLQFDVLIDEAAPEKVMFYEAWESAAAQQTYMAWRRQAGDLTTLLSMLTEAPKFTAMRSLTPSAS